MNRTRTYTAYIPVDDVEKDDLVIARGLSAPEAMKIAFGYKNAWHSHLTQDDYGTFVLYEWRAQLRKESGPPITERLHATVVSTGDVDHDRTSALNMIAAQFLRSNHRYWDGRIESDGDYDKRLARVAGKREVRRIDREIAIKLIDAFLSDGYVITCDLQEDDPEFKRSTDREGILDYLWQVETAQLAVHKNGERSWVSLIFDESGWDVINDYSVDLERIVDPICEPYLPWNQPDADKRDHGIRVLTLNSPDDVLKIENMLK